MTYSSGYIRHLVAIIILSAVSFTALARQQEILRASVFEALQVTQQLNNQKNYIEAKDRIEELDALGQFNPLEVFTIERTRAVVQMSLGDTHAAAKALERAFQTDRGMISERLALTENLTLLHYGDKAYGAAAFWAGRYVELGGKHEKIQLLQAQALYLSEQFAPAVQFLNQHIAADLAAQRTPEELQLRLLASAYQKLKDDTGYEVTLEKLARFHPSPKIWSDLLYRLMRRNDLPAPLEIDVRRLMRVVAAETNGADFLDHAQLALLAGLPSEARQVLDAAKNSGMLREGVEAEKFLQMLAQSIRLQLEDERLPPEQDTQFIKTRKSDPLVNMGLNLVFNGQRTRGIEMISKGLEKGGLKQPQITALRLAYSLYVNGQLVEATKVVETFRGETAVDALARFWLIRFKQNAP